MAKALTQFARIIVGALFIFSGWVKLNDPMGFGFKLEEYFSEGVLGLPFLIPYAVGLAIVICIFEILLGITLLLGIWGKLTVWLLLLMIVFFTFLTFYSAYFNKVTDCGCFGDAIPLTPWQSFGKDVILLILIGLLFFNQRYVQPILSKKVAFGITGLALIFCVWMTNHVLNHLPMVDFRAYKVGTDIAEGMMSAEELGMEPPQFETLFTLENESGERMVVNDKQYIDEGWWEKEEWTLLQDLTESRQVSEGYEPPIHDFALESDTGDITNWVLSEEKMIMVLSYEIHKASPEGLKKIGEWAWEAEEAGYALIGWTSSGYEEVEKAKHEYQMPIDFTTGDGTAIKTVVRSNPGIVAISNGVILGKWHWNDTPSVEELNALYGANP